MNFPAPLTMHASPKILIYKNAVSQNISEHTIRKYSLKLSKSAVTDGTKILSSKYRTSSSSFLNDDDINISTLRDSVCRLYGFNKKKIQKIFSMQNMKLGKSMLLIMII